MVVYVNMDVNVDVDVSVMICEGVGMCIWVVEWFGNVVMIYCVFYDEWMVCVVFFVLIYCVVLFI